MTDPEIPADDAAPPDQGGTLRVPRSRGAVSGVLLMLAGIWGAFVPFVGPVFDFAYSPKPGESWHWTAARGWYEVLPGGIAFLGGLLLLLSANRLVAGFGAWIAVLAGGWFVVGQQVSFLLTLGSPGAPAAAGDRRYVAEYLTFFTGLGAAIILFAALAAGRLSVRSVRDARAAARRAQEAARAEQEAAERDAAEREEYERATADRAATDRNVEAWSAGERDGGYGTPGTRGDDFPPAASAVTTELPAAGSAVAPEPESAPEPAVPQPGASEPAEPPLRLEPPEGHPDAQRFRAAAPEQPAPQQPAPEQVPEQPVPEQAVPEQPVPEHAAPEQAAPEQAAPEQAAPEQAARTPEPVAETPAAQEVWNPAAQSPTTTGELPIVGSTPPPAAAPEPRRGVQAPRRYFGAGNPAPVEPEAPAEPEATGEPDAPVEPETPAEEQPAAAATPERDAVRTDEGLGADDLGGDDLDLNEGEIDERPR